MTATEAYNGESRQRKSTIIRRKLSTNYTTVPNEIFDHGLSLEAVGLLAYLIGRSRNWRVIPKQLCEKFGIGRDKTYRLLDELITAGFVHRSRLGHGGCGYIVFDQARPFPEKPEMVADPLPEKQEVDPLPENTDEPLPENTDTYQRKTAYQRKTERKEAPSTDSAPSALSLDGGHMNGNGKGKEASGHPSKEASKPAKQEDLEVTSKSKHAKQGVQDRTRTVQNWTAKSKQAVSNDTKTVSNDTPASQPSPSPEWEAKSSPSVDAWFEHFWAVYPKRVGRLAAARAWGKALKEASAAQIIAGARRYAAERQDENPQYTKHPTTWLNGGCWMDDPGAGICREKNSAELADEIRNASSFEEWANGSSSGSEGFADLNLTPDEWRRH